jgi:hypothetical protein
MKHVFLLWHSHDLGDGETDDKLIGVYKPTKRSPPNPGRCNSRVSDTPPRAF